MSWVIGANDSPYNIHNLPYGVFTTSDNPDPRIGVRIGDYILDMKLAVLSGNCQDCPTCSAMQDQVLNRFMALGREMWTKVRGQIQQMLSESSMQEMVTSWLVDIDDAQMHMPFMVTDFTGFNSSEYHASNMAQIHRPSSDVGPTLSPDLLSPNWKHQPLGYHGRAASVVPTGTNIARPSGQRRMADGTVTFGPSELLDIEAEIGFVVGVPNGLGNPVGPDAFRECVFGAVLLNDWSARDLQLWEGRPFNSKSFATSMSHWVTPIDALSAALTSAPQQGPDTPDYLKEADRSAYDLQLHVEWNGLQVSRPRFGDMYWTPAQQLAHMTSNGAVVRSGDLYASGAVSGPEKGERGSFMELTWGGQEPVTLADGSRRAFLHDGDAVRIQATAPGPKGTTIALGEVAGTILPARQR